MIHKIFKYLSWALFALAAIFAVYFFVNQSSGLEDKLTQAEQLPSEVKVEKVKEIANEWNGTVLNFAIILFITAAAISLIGGLYKFIKSMIESKQGLITNLISIAVIGFVILLGFALASDIIPQFTAMEKLDFELTNALSKRVGTGLQITYIFFALAILGAVYTEVSKIWR